MLIKAYMSESTHQNLWNVCLVFDSSSCFWNSSWKLWEKILKNLETGRNLHYSFQLFNHHYNQPFVITSNDCNFHLTTNDTAAISSLAAIIDYLQ